MSNLGMWRVLELSPGRAEPMVQSPIFYQTDVSGIKIERLHPANIPCSAARPRGLTLIRTTLFPAFRDWNIDFLKI